MRLRVKNHVKRMKNGRFMECGGLLPLLVCVKSHVFFMPNRKRQQAAALHICKKTFVFCLFPIRLMRMGQRPTSTVDNGCRLKACHQKPFAFHPSRRVFPRGVDARLSALKSFFRSFVGLRGNDPCLKLLMAGFRPAHTCNVSY
jgi:hypothetical protein